MKRILLVLIFVLTPQICCAKRLHKEANYQNYWCKYHNGIIEYRNNDYTRVDCLTETNAVEFDFANAVSSEYDGVRYATSVALYESVTLNKGIKWYYNMFRGSALNEMRKAFPQ